MAITRTTTLGLVEAVAAMDPTCHAHMMGQIGREIREFEQPAPQPFNVPVPETVPVEPSPKPAEEPMVPA
jgi:hypothetical protein